MVKSTSKSGRKNSGKAAVPGSPIIEDEFGNYRIKAGRLNGSFLARAFPKVGSKNQGLIAEAGGASEDDAIETLKELLTRRNAERTAARRREERSNVSVPTQAEFVEALRQTSFSTAQQSMLKAHAVAGAEGLTVVSLMNAGGYKSKDTALKVFARAGAVMADFLGAEIQEDAGTGDIDATRILGYRLEVEENGPAHWIMHEELCQAVLEVF